MSQLRRGRVHVQQGASLVRGVFNVKLTGVVGTFVATEPIRWGASGVGVVVEHDTINQKLKFYRESGELPATLVTITNAPVNTKSASIVSFESDSTPDFATELGTVGGPIRFSRQESGVLYSVNIVGVEYDVISLAALYLEETDPQCPYAFWRDSTSNFNWQKPEAGDIDEASVVSYALDQVDLTLFGPAKVPFVPAGNWAAVGGESPPRYWKDADRIVRMSGVVRNFDTALPSPSITTLPAGYCPSGGTVRLPVVVQGNQIGIIEVSTAGVVRMIAGAYSSSVYLDGVHFRGEQ